MTSLGEKEQATLSQAFPNAQGEILRFVERHCRRHSIDRDDFLKPVITGAEYVTLYEIRVRRPVGYLKRLLKNRETYIDPFLVPLLLLYIFIIVRKGGGNFRFSVGDVDLMRERWRQKKQQRNAADSNN